jgi:hypothetical protein
MAQSTELASVVGTWVAAGIALIALLGVVGPLLIWRASLTERNKAINILTDEGAETGGFVTAGVAITPKISLLRRSKVPDLRSPPLIQTPSLLLDTRILGVSTQSASWVQFGRLLEAYHIDFKRTSSLRIQDGQTWLPIHRSWMLIIGIVGRFGKRKDSGKIAPISTGGVASAPATPGNFVAPFSRSSQSLPRNLRRVTNKNTPGWMTANPNWAAKTIRSSSGSEYKTLHGTIGTLHFAKEVVGTQQYSDESERIYFSRHTASETGELAKEPIGIGHMFWLAVGCLPTLGSKVFSLDDVISITAREEPVSIPHTPSPAARFEAGSDEDSDEDIYYGRGGRYPKSPVEQISPNTFVIPQSSPSPQGRLSKDGRRVFQLSPINGRVEALSEFATIINIDKTQQIFSLEEMELTDKIRRELQQASGTTYVPLNVPWVRLDSETRERGWFLRRADAQQLAQALLNLPMSPQGYLVSANKQSKCRTLLSQAAQSLPQLLTRLSHSIRSMGLDDSVADTLLDAMSSMYAKTNNPERTRLFFDVILGLDEALLPLLHSDPRVNDAIGVLMMTNEEFRALISQSVRHIDDLMATSIELDVVNATLNVPAVMGFIQRFPVHLDVLHPTLPRTDGPLAIKFLEVMFAALRASLKSAALETSLDSLPLFKAFFGLSNVAYLG